MKLDGSRKFLLVFPDEKEKDIVAEEIDKHLERTEYISAINTTYAKARIAKDRPHVVISKITAPELDGYEILEYLSSRKKTSNIPIVLIGEAPKEKLCVDEITAEKVYFLNDIKDEESLSHCLSRVLNHITHSNAENFHLRFLSPGEVLMRAGVEPKFVYIVRKGKLEASAIKDGEKVILGPVDTGEFVGEMAYINGELRSADVTAITDCELIEIPIDMMDKVLMNKQSWSKSMMRTLTHRMKKSNERLS